MPRDLSMKLIATERCPASEYWKLLFSFDPVQEDGEYISSIFNIHYIAEIRFLIIRHNYTHYQYKIATRKIIMTKDLTINLSLFRYPTALCTEIWSDWLNFHNSRSSNLDIEIQVCLTVSKLNSTILKLYEDEEFTDFKLSTVEGSVPVHKAQLAANSEVFKRMLRQEWKETIEGHIKIEGVTLQTLKHLKNYMYLGTLPDDELLPLLQLSMCYMIDNLKAECLMKIARTITAENLYDILAYSFFNNIQEITFAVLAAMPKSIVDDARKIMVKNQKSGKKDEGDKTTEQEQVEEETNK